MTKEENKALIEQYPFLLPRNRFTGKVSADFDYSYTELDEMPKGWRVAFSNPMLQELKSMLVKADFVNDYRITQIKEKYGTLHWYDCGVPKSISAEYWEWQKKYTHLSMRTCVICGQPAEFMSLGWISPYCKKCAAERDKTPFAPIDEFLKED